MKIYFANQSKQTIGGGWTFLDNLKKGLKTIDPNIIFSDDIKNSDIYFISGATMVLREEVLSAKSLNKKIILRVDNIPKNSSNRNTGTSRLKDFAELADLIIYQSEWAREYIGSWLNKKGEVIMNGADMSIFNPIGEKIPKEGKRQYLYIRSSRNESKRWEEAWFYYQLIHRKNKNSNLWIVGQFSDELINYNFDFFNNEKFHFWGNVDHNQMAIIMRSADVLLIPYYNDACSNTLLEGLASGLMIDTIDSGRTGGAPEILKYFFENRRVPTIEEMAKHYYELLLQETT